MASRIITSLLAKNSIQSRYYFKLNECRSTTYTLRKCFFSILIPKWHPVQMNVKNLKIQTKNKSTYSISIEVLGSGAPGSCRSIYVNTRHQKILFNCGEGTRRICNEHNVDVGHVSNIFFTSNSWENISGIPGIQDLISREIGIPFTLYGPAGLNNLMYELCHSFRGDPLSCTEIGLQQIDIGNDIDIQALPLHSSEKPKNIKNHAKMLNNDYILAYIGTIAPNRGHLSNEKLVLAGVPPGPLVYQLKKGLSVTLPDGRVVYPNEVSCNAYDKATFIIIEIPNFYYLDALSNSVAFKNYKGGVEYSENTPEIIVHFSPHEVMLDQRYRDWVNSFSPSVSHLVINKKNHCLGLQDTIEMQILLNHINSKMFPLPVNSGIPYLTSRNENPNKEDLLNLCTLTSEYQFNGPTIQANTLLKYHIRPNRQFDSSFCPVVYPEKKIQSCFNEESIILELKEYKEIFENVQLINNKNSNLPSVLFLGTGSAIPQSRRNCSSILLTVNCGYHILLDCGEGTFSQLVRLMGIEDTYSELSKLTVIFISHIHRDHQMGLVSILLERQNAFKYLGKKPLPLYILAPPLILRYLHQGCSFIKLDNIILLNNIDIVKDNIQSWHMKNIYNSLNLKNISMTFVKHCKHAVGIALTHMDGWKIVYSGDCLPSENLISIGLDCDLLIHEATLEDGLEEDALMKRHSTVSQALQVGREMNAKCTLLTHFSQRYHKIIILEEKDINSEVGVAFDFMKVTLDDLPYLYHIYKIAKGLFSEDFEILKAKQFRREHFS